MGNVLSNDKIQRQIPKRKTSDLNSFFEALNNKTLLSTDIDTAKTSATKNGIKTPYIVCISGKQSNDQEIILLNQANSELIYGKSHRSILLRIEKVISLINNQDAYDGLILLFLCVVKKMNNSKLKCFYDIKRKSKQTHKLKEEIKNRFAKPVVINWTYCINVPLIGNKTLRPSPGNEHNYYGPSIQIPDSDSSDDDNKDNVISKSLCGSYPMNDNIGIINGNKNAPIKVINNNHKNNKNAKQITKNNIRTERRVATKKISINDKSNHNNDNTKKIIINHNVNNNNGNDMKSMDNDNQNKQTQIVNVVNAQNKPIGGQDNKQQLFEVWNPTINNAKISNNINSKD